MQWIGGCKIYWVSTTFSLILILWRSSWNILSGCLWNPKARAWGSMGLDKHMLLSVWVQFRLCVYHMQISLWVQFHKCWSHGGGRMKSLLIPEEVMMTCHQMKTFPRYWPFLREIHRWPVDSPHKGQWCVAPGNPTLWRRVPVGGGGVTQFLFGPLNVFAYEVGEVFPWGGISVIFSVCVSISSVCDPLHEIDLWLDFRHNNKFYGAWISPKFQTMVM